MAQASTMQASPSQRMLLQKKDEVNETPIELNSGFPDMTCVSRNRKE